MGPKLKISLFNSLQSIKMTIYKYDGKLENKRHSVGDPPIRQTRSHFLFTPKRFKRFDPFHRGTYLYTIRVFDTAKDAHFIIDSWHNQN